MGKIEAQALITHFSHPHPLNLTSINCSNPNTIKCSACQKQTSGLVYNCTSCNYCLHKICSEMPEKLKHKADRKHSLTLLPNPAYTTGSFHCNACGVVGKSFCYHCNECEIDMHPACAFTRSSVKGGAHDHPLQLCFEPPYPNKAFVCDVCGGSGSNHWLYRCETCKFDAHLKCGKADKVRIQQPKTDQKLESSSRMLKSKSDVCPTTSPTLTVFEQQPLHQLQRRDTAPLYAGPRYDPGPVYAGPRYDPGPVYGGPRYDPRPGYAGPTRNDTVLKAVSSVVEGLLEGAASQLSQALVQAALEN